MKRWIVRGLMVLGVTGLVLAVLAAVVIHVHQVRFRAQAERLHAEILALQLHPGSFKDLQKLQNEWGEFGSYEGTCTEQDCAYKIAINSGWRRGHLVWDSFIAKRWFFLLYPYLGGRPAEVSVILGVHANRLFRVDFELLILPGAGTGRNHGEIYENFVAASFGSRLGWHDPLTLHEVQQGYRTDWVLHCLGCEYAAAYMTPQTKARDVERFNRMDFSCLTGWRFCRHPVDLAPELWDEAVRLGESGHHAVDSSCLVPADVLAREAEHAALVQVLSFGEFQPRWSGVPYPMVKTRVLELLKNGQSYRKGQEVEFLDYFDPSQFSSGSGLPRLKLGQQYYFLFPEPERSEGIFFPVVEGGAVLQPCHALPKTPETEAAVRQGIAMDWSTGESPR